MIKQKVSEKHEVVIQRLLAGGKSTEEVRKKFPVYTRQQIAAKAAWRTMRAPSWRRKRAAAGNTAVRQYSSEGRAVGKPKMIIMLVY